MRQDTGIAAYQLDERVARWLVCALTLVTFALGIYENDAKSIWWDESLSLRRAQYSPVEILSGRISFSGADTTDQHPPIYFLLLRGMLLLAGENDAVLRFPSACAAAALVPLLYAFAKRLRNSTAGVLAAALGALSPFLLWYAQEARMYALITFLGLLSTYLLWRAITSQKWLLFLAYALVLALGLLTQYLFALLFPAQLLFALYVWPRRLTLDRFKRQHWVGIAALGIPLGVLFTVTILVIQRVPELGSNRTFVPLWIMTRDIFNSFSLGISVNYFQIWPFDLLFWALYIWGLVATALRQPEGVGFEYRYAKKARVAYLMLLLGYIFVPILMMWLFSFITPLYMGSRYLLMSLPAFIIAVAMGLDSLLSRSRLVAILVIAVLFGASAYSVTRYFTAEEYANKEDYRSAARYIAQNESSADVILVNGAETETEFKHYYEGHLEVLPFPALNQSWQDTEAELQSLGTRYDRIWLVKGNTQISDPNGRVYNWLTEHTVMLGEQSYAGYVFPISLTSFYPRDIFTDITTIPADAIGSFDQSLMLDDFSLRYLDVVGQSIALNPSELYQVSVPAGHTIGLYVTMTVQAQLPDYKTSLRILDEKARLIAQNDDVPLFYIPSSQWVPGKAVRFQTFIRIPVGTPPGTYQLIMVMYRQDTGQGLGFTHTGQAEAQGWYEVTDLKVTEGRPYAFELHTLPDGQEPLAQPLRAGPLQLLGYRLPEFTSAGAQLTVPFYWQALEDISQPIELTFAWRDADGEDLTSAPVGLITSGEPEAVWPAQAIRRTLNTLEVSADIPVGEYDLVLSVHPKGENEAWEISQGWWPKPTREYTLGTVQVH